MIQVSKQSFKVAYVVSGTHFRALRARGVREAKISHDTIISMTRRFQRAIACPDPSTGSPNTPARNIYYYIDFKMGMKNFKYEHHCQFQFPPRNFFDIICIVAIFLQNLFSLGPYTNHFDRFLRFWLPPLRWHFY